MSVLRDFNKLKKYNIAELCPALEIDRKRKRNAKEPVTRVEKKNSHEQESFSD